MRFSNSEREGGSAPMDRVAFGMKMASSAVDEEALGPQMKTEAELRLQHLLDKQLAISGRLEQVDFKGASKDLYYVDHLCAGVTTPEEFRQQRLNQKKDQTTSDMMTGKRKRYGVSPLVQSLQLEPKSCNEDKNDYSKNIAEVRQQKMGRHAKELEASLLRGKGRLQNIAHLSDGGVTCRRPLMGFVIEQSELCKGTTPEERARGGVRTSAEVFASPAPSVLDLHTFLEERRQEVLTTTGDTSDVPVAANICIQQHLTETSMKNDETETSNQDHSMDESKSTSSYEPQVSQISEIDILADRLTDAEIKEWQGGKFSNHSPGTPSNVLYVKNLSSNVEDKDLVALFIRYQRLGEQIIFRLMRHGKMKGQCFIIFPDKERAGLALNLLNGYKLKGRPMIIAYGRNCDQRQ